MAADDNQIRHQQPAPGVKRKIAHLENLMVVVYDFTNGPMESPEPYHSHHHEQITFVAAGELKFFKNDEEYHLREGDIITIQPNVSHCIQTLSKHVKLVDSFHPNREDFLGR
jgi:quercetin dioxygenase-like cupin family protein